MCTVHAVIKISIAESCVSGHDLHNHTIIPNLNQMKSHTSQDENTENNVERVLLKHSISSTNIGAINVLCYKVSVVFAVCFIIGCFSLPLIFYYVNPIGGNSKSDPEHSYQQNTSSIEVC